MSTASTLQLSTLMIELFRQEGRIVDQGCFQEACEHLVRRDFSNARVPGDDYKVIDVVAGSDAQGRENRILISIPIEHDEAGVSERFIDTMTRSLHYLMPDLRVISIGFDQ